MEKIGIFYGSTEGNTEEVVKKVQKSMGNAVLHNVDAAKIDDLDNYKILIFAASTWNIGELQEDWEAFIDLLDDLDFHGKSVAFIGVGDAHCYPDTFVDGIGMIYESIANSGATFIGTWPTTDYSFETSKGVINGKFLGLVLDEDNEHEKTDARIASWTLQIKGEIGISPLTKPIDGV